MCSFPLVYAKCNCNGRNNDDACHNSYYDVNNNTCLVIWVRTAFVTCVIKESNTNCHSRFKCFNKDEGGEQTFCQV